MNTGFTLADFESLLADLEKAPMQKEFAVYARGKNAWELMGRPMRVVVKRRKGKLRILFVPNYPKGTWLFTSSAR